MVKKKEFIIFPVEGCRVRRPTLAVEATLQLKSNGKIRMIKTSDGMTKTCFGSHLFVKRPANEL